MVQAVALFTLVEVAQWLRKSPRWLLDWLRRHPVDQRGRAFYAQAGRDKRFTEEDRNRIYEAMKETACRSMQVYTPISAVLKRAGIERIQQE